MTIRETQKIIELKCMAAICVVIDLIEWITGLFCKPCSEKVNSDDQNDNFDFTFDFDTYDHSSLY